MDFYSNKGQEFHLVTLKYEMKELTDFQCTTMASAKLKCRSHNVSSFNVVIFRDLYGDCTDFILDAFLGVCVRGFMSTIEEGDTFRLLFSRSFSVKIFVRLQFLSSCTVGDVYHGNSWILINFSSAWSFLCYIAFSFSR